MTPEEFDIDFDFDKEYGFDAPPAKPAKEEEDDFDLDAILARELGEDFDEKFEAEFASSMAAPFQVPPVQAAPVAAPVMPPVSQDMPAFEPSAEEPAESEPVAPAEEIAADEFVDYSMFENKPEPVSQPAPDADSMINDTPYVPQNPVPVAPLPQAPVAPNPRRRKPAKSGFNLWAFLTNAGADNNRAKPRSKMRRFKEDYLPLIISGVTVLMILIFIIGSISNAIANKKNNEDAQLDAIQQSEAAAQEAAAAQQILDDAAKLAAGYDYQGAIDMLDSFADPTNGRELTDEMVVRRSEYAQTLSQLVAWDNPSKVTNLSFHALIADPSRAFTNASLGTKYNKNFVTTDEFSAILEQLYANDYVLVGLDDIVYATTGEDGSVTYAANTLYLPDGKTPIMITETLVNYFTYMVDGNEDGVPDAEGAGFAHRLVLDDNGDVKAEMITADGDTVVGDYDLVPILESFIAEHPDFSYQGARALLAVTGSDGLFGWRIANGEDQVNGAKEMADALREKGYIIACNSYSNINYGTSNATQISNDLKLWRQHITPILGDVDIIVIAQGGEIGSMGNYSGTKFDILYQEGFRYFIGANSAPAAELNNKYFHQQRLMVTGTTMYNSESTYAAYFDARSILNEQRGAVPQ